TKSLPSSDTPKAFASNMSRAAFERVCMPRPSRPSSQPTPTAPGPNLSQCGEIGQRCSSVRCAPPDFVGCSMMLIQLTAPPNSHVAEKDVGGAHDVIVPLALFLTWKRPPSFSSPSTCANQ